MKEVWGYDLNKYGSFMLHTGRLLTTVLPESAGLTAADIGFGVVFLALYMLEMHILMCLALRGTPCFDGEGLMQLGSEAVGAVAEGIDAQADSEVCQNYLLGVQVNGAKIMAGLYGGKDPCGLEPEEEKEDEYIVLYHYTSKEGYAGIMSSGELWASTGYGSAWFGDGQYFTDINDGEASVGSPYQLSRALFTTPWKQNEVTHFVEVQLPQKSVELVSPVWSKTYGNKSIYLHRSTSSLSVSDKILRSGAVYYQRK